MTDGRKRVTRAVGYTVEVHEKAFYFWYKYKSEMKEIRAMLGENLGPDIKLPSIQTLREWKMLEDWDGHADALDGQAEQAGDIEIIHQRQDIIKKLADVGGELVDKGMKYLREHDFDNTADAIRAIGKGAELQDKLLGWAAYFAELSTATNEELEKKLKRYMGEEPIEATAIDATEQDDTERPE